MALQHVCYHDNVPLLMIPFGGGGVQTCLTTTTKKFLVRTVHEKGHPSGSLPRPEAFDRGATSLFSRSFSGPGTAMFICAPSANTTALAPAQARRPIPTSHDNTWEGQITQEPPSEAAFRTLNRPSVCSCGCMKCEALMCPQNAHTQERLLEDRNPGQKQMQVSTEHLKALPRESSRTRKSRPKPKGTNSLSMPQCHPSPSRQVAFKVVGPPGQLSRIGFHH